MKFLKIAAAAALVAAAMPSFATIQVAQGDNTELVLAVWSQSAGASYLQDLGLTVGASIVNFNTAGYSFSAAVTSALTSHANLAGAADLRWMIVGFDTANLDLAPGKMRLLTTVDVGTTLPTQTIGDALQNATIFDAFLLNNNALASHNSVANGASYAVTGTAEYLLNPGSPAENMRGNLDFAQGNAVGVASSLLYITSADEFDSGLPVTSSVFLANATFNGTTLTINAAAAAVPEPESYALMLAGLAGLAVLRRRQQR